MEHTTNHVLHAILTLIFLPWVFIWILASMETSQQNNKEFHKNH